MSILKFELKMSGKENNGAMMMGIMDAKYIESANTDFYIGGQHQMTVFIRDNDYPYRYINGEESEFQSDPVKWNIGDRLRLDFDLKGRRCTVFLNDQLLESLTENLPGTFYLAVSAKWKDTKLETTMFEFV